MSYPDTNWVLAKARPCPQTKWYLLKPSLSRDPTEETPASLPLAGPGTTKGTGVLFDALKYRKPLVLPEGFQSTY